jgi:nicotinamidase/pyrazinamidase
MSEFAYLAADEAATERFGAALARALPAGTTIALLGTLGAGKTRLVQALAAALGVPREQVVSPTFVLHQQYHGSRSINHLDAYRLHDEDEFRELGVEELFDSDALTIIEWAERIAAALPDEYLQIEIEVTGPTERRFTVRSVGQRFEPVIAELRTALPVGKPESQNRAVTALLLVDIQNDFLPGGALAVPHGDEVVPVANRLLPQYAVVIATQDWHPPDHQSFASQHPGRHVGQTIDLAGLPQMLWPDHCVRHTPGAELAAGLARDRIQHVVQKGTDREIDSYSGFFDNARRKPTGLDKLLRELNVRELHIMGLATDYCVKATALDAVDLGFHTVLLAEGIRGVELAAGDCDRAIAAMSASGVKIRGSSPVARPAE